jgi:hypothetical protein
MNNSITRYPDDNSGQDHYYFNLVFENNSQTNINSPAQYIPAQVKQLYDRPILNRPEDYNVSCIRFSITSNFIARCYQSPGTTGGNSDYIVGVGYNGVYYNSPIIFPTYTLPDGTIIGAIYQINELLQLINAGYASAQTALLGSTGYSGPTGVGDVLMTYDPISELYTMNIPVWYGSGTFATGGAISVNMSYQLYHKFQSFSIFQNTPLLYNGDDIFFNKFFTGNNLQNIVWPIGATGTGVSGPYFAMVQDAPWASSIMDITRLIIQTNSIPVVNEFRAQQEYLQFGANNANQTISMLTDFFIGSDTMLQNRSQHWEYVAQIYRLTALQGNVPIRQIDIQVYVATSTGQIFQLYLGPTDSIDVKLLFLKKGLTS